MHRRLLFVGVLLACALAILFVAQSPNTRGDQPAPKFGLDKRVPWTTSHVQGSPQPPSPYRTEFAFPKLPIFDEPLDITNAPGSDRLFITERYGKIFSIRNDPKVTKADLLLDMNQVLGRTAPKTMNNYGFAPHPKFAENGFVYVTYVIDLTQELPKGTRVSRFHASGDPPVADPKSERILVEWPCGGHNGGCLRFGPDGYLYIGTGDSSGIADQYLTGQRLDTLAGKMLRIDVDHPDTGKSYGSPKDNPFVGVQGALPEIWAYGLRQPWKYSFDSATGDLWCGNVGQDLWEQVYLLEKGGNYGWSVLEGSHAFRPERPRGPSPILMPVVEHDHANFRSLTGGYVYHGKQLPELSGAYIYGDYDSGRIWSFRYDRQKKTVSEHRELCKTNIRIVCFAEDNNGELFILDHVAGRISKLVPNPAPKNAQPFPRKLSETGLFSSTKDHAPAPGLIPYSVIAPQWMDGATKQRFIALPGESKLEFETILYPQGAPGASPGWKFPDGAVVVETISLEMEKGKPESSRRLETRILHQQRMAGTEEMGDQYWQGYSYVWNDEQTDAVLLEDPQGRDRAFQILDSQAPGGKRQQTWHYPSTTECSVCHMPASKYTIAVLTQQMDRDHDYGGIVANQLRTFEHIGLFTKPLPMPPEEMPHLVNYRDRSQPLDLRARSYLQSNCAHCHRKWGGGNAEFQMLATLELQDMGIVNVRPNQGTFNIPNAKVLSPGDPYHSIMFYRMSTLGPGHMPRMGSNVIDESGVRLIHDWIAHLPGTGQMADAPKRVNDRLNFAVRFLRGEQDSTAEAIQSQVDPFLTSPATALRLMPMLGDELFPSKVRDVIVARAMKLEQPEVRDLFERFLPEEQRIKRLGAIVKPEQILAIPGDVERGRKLFFDVQGVQCKNCHRIGGKGQEVGPDLDAIGKKYDRAAILDNILFPSKQIDQKYLTYRLETKRGIFYSGLLVSKDDKKVVLKDANAKQIEVKAEEVESLAVDQKSLMPELLLRDLTAEQVADLTAYLSSLK